MKKILIYLVVSVFTLLHAEYVSFADLVKLASKDIGKNIYLEGSIKKKDYLIDIDFSKNPKHGDIFAFLESVLADNNLYLQESENGNNYYIRKDNYISTPVTLPELPIVPDNQKTYYYSYRIKNITNVDVVKVMSIFTDELNNPIKYTYLSQSDIIAYRSTKSMHQKIKRMLVKSDNTVRQSTIKITLFTTNKNNFKSYGSNIRAFSYDLDSSLFGVLSALKSSNSQRFDIKDQFNFSMTLFALQGRGLANIVQEPTLFITNGSKTSVNYVKNVAYKESTTTFKDNTQTTTDQIKYRDIGFSINVLPKIKDNWVYLDLSLVSEELLSLKDNIPLTQKISYRSKVKVYKGKPVLLTGLKKTSEKIERDGVPLLSDLPWIGELFKKRSRQIDEQNINILIEVL